MPHTRPIPRGAWLLLLALSLGCGRDASTPAEIQSQYAKGGNGGGGSGGSGGSNGGDPTVSGISPASAPQDTTLTVRIFGSSFDKGSKVSFALGGVTSTKVVTNSTSYVSSTELSASVTVAADADKSLYDVIVVTAAGKKGIGSELLEITQGDQSLTWLVPLDDAGLALASDGKYPDGEYSAYSDGVCGVTGRNYWVSGSGDMRVQTDLRSASDRKCKDYPRKVTLRYPDNATETVTWAANVHQVASATTFIPVGATVKRGLNMTSWQYTTRCDVIKFKAEDQFGVHLGADSVLVTRIDAQTWDVRTQDPPNNKGYCTTTGELLSMPLRFRIVAAQPLP